MYTVYCWIFVLVYGLNRFYGGGFYLLVITIAGLGDLVASASIIIILFANYNLPIY